jgi:hypothetical protein
MMNIILYNTGTRCHMGVRSRVSMYIAFDTALHMIGTKMRQKNAALIELYYISIFMEPMSDLCF